jgi:hypothetical protein
VLSVHVLGSQVLIHLGTTLGHDPGVVFPGLEGEVELGLELDVDVLLGDCPADDVSGGAGAPVDEGEPV